MQIFEQPLIPTYSLKPDQSGNQHFRVYNYNNAFPNRAEVLVPHKKDYFLMIFIRKGGSRFWIDQSSHLLKDNALYLINPGQVVVKEEMMKQSSTGIAFTYEFLTFGENASLGELPIIKNPAKGHEIVFNENDMIFIEDILAQINIAYENPDKWQRRMLGGYLTVLLTYLSKLYQQQFLVDDTPEEHALLNMFLKEVNVRFKYMHEVKEYAALMQISCNRLSESVKQQSGKAAIKHIHDRLIMEARRLLMHSDKTLKEIAYILGFSEVSYFSRFFKRETGTTPAVYRVNIREICD
jgi:AraC-like DNA-binding protein